MQTSISIRALFMVVVVTWVIASGCDTSSNVEPRFNNIFLKFYGGGSDFEAVDFQLDTDLGFIIVGNSTSIIDPDSSAIIMIKTDNLGNEQERAVLDFSVRNAKASSVRIIPEGYLVGGTIVENDTNKIVVAKYSGVGTLINSTSLIPDSIIYRDLVCNQLNFDNKGGTGDGYLVAGSIRIIGTNKIQTYTQRLNDDLTIDPTWQGNVISGPTNIGVNQEFQSPGVTLLPTVNADNYFVFGTTSNPEQANTYSNETFFSRRLFINGSPEREGNYGADVAGMEIMGDAIRYSSSEYLMVGTNESNVEGTVVVSLARFNSQTLVLSETNSFGYSETPEGNPDPLDLTGNSGNIRRVGQGVLITGSAGLSEDISDVFLASLDQTTGARQWFATFGFDGESEGVKVFQNDDGSIMLLATVATFGSESTRSRIALIKTNGDGLLK